VNDGLVDELHGAPAMTGIASATGQEQPGSHPELRWLVVWTRAVVGPAARRADAVWIGCAIVAAVLFGPTALHPRDVTELALHDPSVGVVLGATWLLIFVPVARGIVRPAPAAYLRSLPGAPRGARIVAALALVTLQLPWLALWVLGDGARGLAIVLATTGLAIGLAAWRPPSLRGRAPVWRGPGQALRAIHLRALRRRAGDAVMRGAGLAVLAGAAAGLLVRNNQLTGEAGGVLGASVLAVALVPARVGVALVTLAAYRDAAWLAASTGIAPRTRIAALVHAVGVVHVAATLIGLVAATAIAGGNPWLVGISLTVALGTALGEARAIVAAERAPSAPSRIVIGAIVVVAVAVVCLSLLDAAGAAALAALAVLGLVRVMS
jgi:hypothetical protein